MAYEVKSVLNQDVAGLTERVDEVIYEVARSQSANLTDMRPFDRTRITEYNAMLNATRPGLRMRRTSTCRKPTPVTTRSSTFRKVSTRTWKTRHFAT
jgi:hypothetical protein